MAGVSAAGEKSEQAQLSTTVVVCTRCQNGVRMKEPCCTECGRLHPLAKNHRVAPELFQWAQDGQAMAKLRAIPALHTTAKRVADRVGRPWIEATFNGVRLSNTQMPEIYRAAVNAARILGLSKMPAVYVSGERPWEALTFGSDDRAFIVIGSALAASFRGLELQFILGRELGHVLAGHALWKTVLRFLVGEHNPRRGLLQNGIAGLMDPSKWLEGAIEIPLLGWARQAEITADRAGLLTVPNLEIARRVLISWSLKSPVLYRQINVAEWLQQQISDTEDQEIQLAELINSPTPYLCRRLKLLTDYEVSSALGEFRQRVRRLTQPRAQQTADMPSGNQTSSDYRLTCPACSGSIRVPINAFEAHEELPVRCPHQGCHGVHRLKRTSIQNAVEQSSLLNQKETRPEAFDPAGSDDSGSV